MKILKLYPFIFLWFGMATLAVSAATPTITLNTPASQLNISAGLSFTFTWQTSDPNANATITLYLDADNNPATGLIPIVGNIQNSAGNSVIWQASPVLAGTNYYVYAAVTDGITTNGGYAPGRLQIDPLGAFQLLSSIVDTNATYIAQYFYYGTAYSATNQLIIGANVVSVTNGTVVHQFIVTRLASLAQVEAMQYNPLNQITTTTNGNGIVTTLTYDPLGRLVQRQPSEGALVTYGYDVLGNRFNMTESTGKTFYSYDGLSQFTNITPSASSVLGAADNLSLSNEYDLAGQDTAIFYTGGERIQYTYDYFDGLTNVVYGDNGVINNTALSVGYTYDGNGNRLTMTTRTNNAVTEIRYYTYGAENRLLAVTNQNGMLLNAYSYDPAGNRIQKVATNYTAFYTYDERNLLTSYADATNQILYAYNGDAQRMSRTLNGALTSYVIDPNRSLYEVVQERDHNNNITASYTFGAARLATWNGSAVTFELNDRLGSVRLVTDANGNVIQSYNYDVFGATR